MSTREIWHEILINASPDELYRAVTDVNKLAHWWTTDARGESAIGKRLEFWFSGILNGFKMRRRFLTARWAGPFSC